MYSDSGLLIGCRPHSVFDTNSKRFCDVCRIEVSIGTGGESNWTNHTKSGAHTCAQVALQKNKVSNYFSKAPQAAQPPTPLSSVVQPARLSSSAFSAITPHVGLQAGTSNTSSTFMIGRDQDGEGADLAGSLIDRLRVAIRMLPITVLVGTEDDVLGQFARAPFVDPSEYDDAWEMVDKTLNGAIGYGMSIAAVSAIIRRGRFGMDGLCDWLETCILEYGINPNLLEGKVQRLLDAMSLLCVFFKFSPSYVIFTTLISGFMYRKL